jgi:aryl-phospho-beta-D-glucosidase BglC (GH1 family)
MSSTEGTAPTPRRRARWAGLAVAALVAALTAVAPVVTSRPAAAAPAEDWLHVEGNQIVDETGNPVWLTGANWFGLNATERAFHGLWSGNIVTITRSMADRGINIVRVPISTQLLLEWKSGTFVMENVNTYENPELLGMNGLEIFDYWLGLCEQYGLKVLLDVHSAEADNSGHIYPVWYKGSITAEQFYQAWEWVTSRYRDNDTIVAMDIKNEPHGKQNETLRAKWDGSTDVDNWKNTCQVAGRRILAINPNLLILCEGIEVYPRSGVSWTSTGLGDYYGNWWGGNLRGVRDHPVDLGSGQDRLVYSPHDYGPLVYEQPWFQGDFDKTSLTNEVWRPNWLYIHENGTAPLLIGEWGGRLGEDERQDRWMTAMRDLIVQYGLHHTFWCLNPNSGDTGGLLNDDWATWDETKYALLKPALWQHQGKFVGLDHQVPLGGPDSTTGITVTERYADGGGPDTTAPSAPGQPVADEVTAASAVLTWGGSTSDDVVAYDVLRSDGAAAPTVVATVTGTRYQVTGLSGETTYTFSVRARDATGNVSAASAGRSVTTPAGASGNDGCSASYQVSMSWAGGFTGQMVVQNTGSEPITGWTVTWANPPSTSIDSVWSSELTVSGASVTVTNDSFTGTIPVDGAVTFGFTGTGSATAPEIITCSAS